VASTEPLRTGAAPGEYKKLAHIVLQTGQLPVLRDWYLKVLDAHVVLENDMLSFMTFDEEHHRLAMVQLPQPVPRTSMTVGLAHSAYTFGSLDSLLTKYAALKEVGIQPHVPVQHGPTTSLYYRDPDGNMVELQIDNIHRMKPRNTCAEKSTASTQSARRSIRTPCSPL
jgi:catechol-2,3-dioxygenase